MPQPQLLLDLVADLSQAAPLCCAHLQFVFMDLQFVVAAGVVGVVCLLFRAYFVQIIAEPDRNLQACQVR